MSLNVLPELIERLAAENRLWAHNDGDEFTTADLWFPATLFQAILEGTKGITPLFALSSRQNDRYALTITDNDPKIVIFEAAHTTGMIKCATPKIAGPGGILDLGAKEDMPQIFLPKRVNREMDTPRLFRIKQEYLATYLTDAPPIHPARALVKITDNRTLKNTALTKTWLKQATLQEDNDNTRSKLTLPYRVAELPLPRDIQETIVADLQDSIQDAEEVLTKLAEAQVIDVGLLEENSVTGPDQQEDGQEPRQDTANDDTDQTEQQPNSGNETNQGTEAERTALAERRSRTETLRGPARGRTGAATPASRSGSTTNQTEDTQTADNPAEQLRRLAQKRLITMLSQQTTLSSTDQQTVAALANLYSRQTPQATGDTTSSTEAAKATRTKRITSARLYSLLGWANKTIDEIELFHTETNDNWRDLIEEPSLTQRLERIMRTFAQQIALEHRQTKPSLHHEWGKNLASWQFAPHRYSTKMLGLGPLAYAPRSISEVQHAEQQRRLNEEATTISTADIKKTKLNAPILPKTVMDVIHVLDCCMQVLIKLFTKDCKLALGIGDVIDEMYANSAALAEYEGFQYEFGAEVLWQVTLQTAEFFETVASETDIRTQKNLPQVQLEFLKHQIRTGQLTQSSLKPAIFQKPLEKGMPRHQPGPNKRQKTETKKESPRIVHKKKIDSKAYAIIKAFQDGRQSKQLPPMSVCRAAAGVDTPAELATFLGLQPTDCLRYNIYGACNNPRCRMQHVERTIFVYRMLVRVPRFAGGLCVLRVPLCGLYLFVESCVGSPYLARPFDDVCLLVVSRVRFSAFLLICTFDVLFICYFDSVGR